ncbi:envelope glycoprotein [Simian immunodeficiency virus - agm.sab-1]|uniref:Envelope glycoprotein gp160 n=1 Tax=Simian immunodeficiency virus - agm.sab-1 TaxID=349974 RepID=Q87113_SIVSA|nr:env polyprotein - simian immunodeficiency virus SIVagm (isolate SAB-1) [Simian immunodeficiency virus - agm]AAA21510.1 envelope glycoprotein [Simian immunodeficiency virus - agm.sab-1]
MKLLTVLLWLSGCWSLVWLVQYVTVFYGIPVWKNSSVQAFCKTPNTNLWASTNCIPDDEPEGTIAEVPIPNITEKFDAWKNRNPLVGQAESNIHLLFESTLKPCVKLSPMCIKMNCYRLEGGAATTTSPSTSTARPEVVSVGFNDSVIEQEMEKEQAMNCSFAMAGYRRDVKKNYSTVWDDQEVVCEEGREKSNATHTVGCYMIHCNTSVIKEACDKTYWDTFRLRYCAPAGYALLRCADTDYSGHKACRNVTVSACTRLINTTVSTGIGINGSYVANRTEIWQKNGNSNDSVIIRLNRYFNLTIRCRRPGNKTVLPVTIMAGLVFHSQKYNTRLKQAWCWFGGNWRGAWKEVKETIVRLPPKKYSGTNDTNKIFLQRQWGDPESEFFFFNCQGEFFYCKMDWFLNYLNNKSVDPDHNNCAKNNTKPCWQRTYVPCHIRQVVNDWYTLSKKTYAPPREGHLECNSTATALYVELNYNSKNRTNVTLSPQIESIWANELGDYKLVEIKPIGFAPTKVRRYTGPERQKRVPFVLGFLGFLGAAGAAMGAAATALTVQSQQLLAGILQQQKNLLAAVEQQQQMLKLTIWGVKNLNARVTALEKYLEDQARLNIWGCAFRQVCHTTVLWKYNNTPDWENMTWQEWERQIEKYEANISRILEQAHEQEQKNLDSYQKLVSWSDFWSWFDLTKWFGWMKIAIMVIAGIIVARVLLVIIGILRKFRKGYAPLSSLPSSH